MSLSATRRPAKLCSDSVLGHKEGRPEIEPAFATQLERVEECDQLLFFLVAQVHLEALIVKVD